MPYRGRSVHVQICGDGPVTLLLLTGLGVPALLWHGLGDPDEGWADEVAGLLHSPPWGDRPFLVPLLAAHTRVVTSDRAGLGSSTPPNEVRDLDDFVAELDAVVQAVAETGPLLLVGHSVGGLIAWEYARLNPGRLAGLALLDSSHPDQLTRLPQRPAAEQAQYLRRMADDHPERPDLPSLLDQGPEVAAPGVLGELPLLVLSRDGADGPWTQLQSELARTSRRGRQLTLPATGHYLHLDAPDAVARAVLTLT